MCGIAGWIDYKNDLYSRDDIFASMSDTLKDRGPDAGAIYKTNFAAIIHRRLIVVDPENGKQPMRKWFGGEEYVLTYNGEIYNTDTVRNNLKAKGYTFTGHSDTEVVLTAYAHYKEECVKHLNGIFAFGVLKTKTGELFLARDRIGVKPLFYFETAHGIIFGSQIKTLLAHPAVNPDIDIDGLRDIFLIGPGRTLGQGVFKGISEIKPGQFLTLSRDTGVSLNTYWSVTAKEHPHSFEETKEYLRELIFDSIESQLVSDVPLCTMLSGGLDSSIISMVAAKKYAQQGKQLTTYSVDYKDNDINFASNDFQPEPDSMFTKLISDYISSDHRVAMLDNDLLFNTLSDATYARDLPGMTDIDSSLLLFCREIKKNFTVAISGECADEIFGGYPWYHDKDVLFADTFPWSRSIELRKSIFKNGFLGTDPESYVTDRYSATTKATDKLSTDSTFEGRMREMFMLNFNWFMQTLLDRKDRMSMATGLEVRVPFCDYRLVEYAYNMPFSIKSYHGREKGIVREAVAGLLPEEILWRKKSPYPKTYSPEYFKNTRDLVLNMLDDKSSYISSFVNKDKILELVENPDALPYPWYGQLMRTPQIFAYLIQFEFLHSKTE